MPQCGPTSGTDDTTSRRHGGRARSEQPAPRYRVPACRAADSFMRGQYVVGPAAPRRVGRADVPCPDEELRCRLVDLVVDVVPYSQELSARSSMDRAFASGAKGCRFESCRAHRLVPHFARFTATAETARRFPTPTGVTRDDAAEPEPADTKRATGPKSGERTRSPRRDG